MNLLQHLMKRLRPVVGLKNWDYCVLWKLSEDQRFIEWMDCCCAGTENIENGGEESLFTVSAVLPCRDVIFQHPRTKSCDLLAQLPSSIPLDSGIHAQTLISNQARWLNFSNSSDSNGLEETVGTRVLIPVPVGLIELFVDKQVSEDQSMIDFITTQFNFPLEQQTMINTSPMDSSFSVNINAINDSDQKTDPNNIFQPPVSKLQNLTLQDDISVDQNRLSNNSHMNFFQQFNYAAENGTKNNDIFLGSTNESFTVDKILNPFKSSGENGFDQEMDALQKQMHIMEPLSNKRRHPAGNDKDSMNPSDSISDCSDPNDDDDDAKCRKRNGKGPQSKNLVAERKRRKKLNDRLYTLRSLVPKISKLDRASILGDAIEFVMELQKQVSDLQNELEEHSDGGADNNHSNLQSEVSHLNGINNLGPKSEHEKLPNGTSRPGELGSGGIEICKQNHDSEITNEKVQQMEPQVEVAQLDGNEFFVKVFCEHKAGGFVKLMEALNSLGLEVTNVNVTSFLTLVVNVFKVEKRDTEMVQADQVRDFLLELTRNPSRGWPEMAKATENGNGMDHHHHHNHPLLHSHQLKSQSHHRSHPHHIHNQTLT